MGECVTTDGTAFMLYPPIVPTALFERVSQNAAVRKEVKGGARSNKIVSLLAGAGFDKHIMALFDS